MNSRRPAPFPAEIADHPDSTGRTGRGGHSAAVSHDAGLRPVLVVSIMTASLLGSSLVGRGYGFGALWLVSNTGLHLVIAAWFLTRPGGATAGMLSAGALTAYVLIVYGSWAPALAAGEPFASPVPGPVSTSALEYTTAAALVVAGGAVLASTIYGIVRGTTPRVNHHSAVPPSRWWRGVLILEAIGLCCFAAFKVSIHQPVISLALFRPAPASIAPQGTSSAYQFLSAGIDVSIGAAIAASGLLGLKTYRFRVFALIALNLFLYATIGFKYRLVVTIIGVFGVWATTRPHERRLAPRSQRMKAILTGVLLTAVAFLVVQVFRGDHQSSQAVTASSFDLARAESIATRSIGIAAPYAAIHQAHFGLLLGKSYLELPRLFVPQAVLGDKPLPAMSLLIQAVTTPGAGAAVPLWAEADANFGLVGLVCFGAILGWVVSHSDTADRRGMETATVAAATGATLASVLSRSLMFFALYEFAVIVLPIWTLGRWGARRGTRGYRQAGARPK